MYFRGGYLAGLLLLLARCSLGAPIEQEVDIVSTIPDLVHNSLQKTLDHLSPISSPSLTSTDSDSDSDLDFDTDTEAEANADIPLSIPSRYESTVLGRRLLAQSKAGVLTTIFPSNISNPRVPSDVAHTPIGLPDYIASCEEPSGNPTLLALTISTSTINAAAGSNVSLSLSWWDEYIHLTHHQPWSAANLPRLSLIGYLEEITKQEVQAQGIEGCFVGVHGDSRLWLPGKKWAAHQGLWMRLVVKEIYWIGGFGDRNYIGWFDPAEWKAVGEDEWQGVRLPGEK